MAKSRKGYSNEKDMEEFSYRTVLSSVVFSGVFFIISLLFNGEFISITIGDILLLMILENVIRVFSILCFYIFITISIGNYKELTGKPITWVELSFFFIISLIQSFLDLTVFLFTLLGLLVIIVYFWIVQ